MRRLSFCLTALLLLIAVALTGALGSADARSKRRTCHLKHSKTYKRNKEARLFTRNETHDTLDGTRLYGCHLKTKKRIVLADTGYYDPDAVLVKLRGRFVAVNYTASDREDQRYGYLRLWDLRRAKRLANVKDEDASDVEIGPKGQLVWIGKHMTNLGQPEPPPSVHVLDRNGDHVLATGNIAEKSLTIRGTTVYWTQDGSQKSAQL